MSLEAELQAEVDGLHSRLAELETRLRRTYRTGRTPGSRVRALLITIESMAAAFELDAVREVIPAALLSPLPEAPSWVLGTLNLRGDTIPVIHIGARLGRGERELGVDDLIVIVSTQLGVAGFVVSEVGAIVSVEVDDKASLVETPHASYVVGTFSTGGTAYLLLGIQELLRQSDLAHVLRHTRGEG